MAEVQEQTQTNDVDNVVEQGQAPPPLWNAYSSAGNLNTLDTFLENEKNTNASKTWAKLDKTTKLLKLRAFADVYKKKNDIDADAYANMIMFFRDCLDRKRLQRVKDVIYDKDTGEISDIPALVHARPTNHFTLKNTDKRVSTLKSLAPKRRDKTCKKKGNGGESDDDDTIV